MDAMVDKNLYALVVSGQPTEKELTAAWEAIRMEYADKIGDLEYRAYQNLFKEIGALKALIDEVRDLVSVLQDTYVDVFARKLNNLLVTDFIFDVTDPEEYDRQLHRCYNMTGGFQLRLELLKTNFDALSAKFEGNKEPGREYYLALLITLSDNAGYALPETITVFEFCERMARAQKRTEMLKKKANGRH